VSEFDEIVEGTAYGGSGNLAAANDVRWTSYLDDCTLFLLLFQSMTRTCLQILGLEPKRKGHRAKRGHNASMRGKNKRFKSLGWPAIGNSICCCL
jgi:hypothetical protein